MFQLIFKVHPTSPRNSRQCQIEMVKDIDWSCEMQGEGGKSQNRMLRYDGECQADE